MMFDKKSLNKYYIGNFHIHGSTMSFVRKEGLRRKDLIATGDMVYFMFVGDELYKIGKAGGAQGFASRVGTYNRGRLGDATNNRIIDVMEDINEQDIEVYGVPIPRQILEVVDPLSGEKFDIEVSMHGEFEKRYTTLYLDEDAANELPFCRQID